MRLHKNEKLSPLQTHKKLKSHRQGENIHNVAKIGLLFEIYKSNETKTNHHFLKKSEQKLEQILKNILEWQLCT